MHLQSLKQIMAARGLTQADIARLAGVSRAAVTKWFKARRPQVNVEVRTLMHLANKLGIPPASLLKRQQTRIASSARSTPSFMWDYPLSTEEIRAILTGPRKQRLWLVAKILQHAKWAEIWSYLTPRHIAIDLPLLRLPEKTKQHWQYALQHWGYT